MSFDANSTGADNKLNLLVQMVTKQSQYVFLVVGSVVSAFAETNFFIPFKYLDNFINHGLK